MKNRQCQQQRQGSVLLRPPGAFYVYPTKALTSSGEDSVVPR